MYLITMKLISWNVNGIRACYKNGLRDFLVKEKPDIFCVQETKAHPEQLTAEKFEDLYAHRFWSSSEVKKGYSGTCTFLKEEAPLEVMHGIEEKRFDQEGRFVVTRHEDFLLYNVYFPNGAMNDTRHDFKQDFLKTFTEHLKEQIDLGEEIVLVGDYNVARLPFDVYDSEKLKKTSGFLPEERSWFNDSFLPSGFVDVFRHFNPEKEKSYTWWSYRTNARLYNRGWRIDYVCVTPGLIDHVKSFKHLDEQRGSDHCPVQIEFDL